MIKQIILIILLSVVAIFFHHQLSHVLNGLVYAHHYITKALQTIFSEGHTARLIQEIISLLILPFLGGLIVAIIFWMSKRSAMPYAMAVIWILWLVLLVTMVAQNTPMVTGAPLEQKQSATTK